MCRGLGHDSEMDQRQSLRSPPFDLVDRLEPDVEVEVRRRCRRENRALGGNADTGRIAGIERPGSIEGGDVVTRMPLRWEAIEPEDSRRGYADVLLRDRRELTPEGVEGVAVESPGARLEPAGIGKVRRADLRDVHLQFGVIAHEHACSAGVVEVDV